MPLFLCMAVAACGTPDARRPEGTVAPVAAGQTRLAFDLPALSAGKTEFRRYTSANGKFAEEYGLWNAGKEGASAGLLLTEAKGAEPLLDAKEPGETIGLWRTLRDKKPAFAPLNRSRNANGPISWRRAAVGTRICVLFLQRLPVGRTGGRERRAILTGYYCNPPGTTLPPLAAEAAAKAPGLRRPAPGLRSPEKAQ